MLMLAMTCARSHGADEAIRMVMRGELAQAIPIGLLCLERRPAPEAAAGRALLGQTIGRALIELGREEEAEELFRRQMRAYDVDSRPHLRWMSSLDNGVMQLMQNRLGRAADAFNTVADDPSAPPELRIESLAGLAVSLRGLGEYRRAERLLAYAETLASQDAHAPMRRLLQALKLETAALRALRPFDDGGDTPGGMPQALGAGGDLLVKPGGLLETAARTLEAIPIAAQRLRFLASLLDANLAAADRAGQIAEELGQLRRRKLVGHERECRLEAAMAHLAHGDGHAVQPLLQGLVRDEDTVRRHRNSLELKYCMSRIYALQGKHMDALRLYKEHAAQALFRLRAELAHLPHTRCIEKEEMAERSDSTKMLLPMRYRRAYQYILDHLDDRDLSVRQIAAQIDVTERALQMAFRSHLGLTPVELIRRRRMEHIRKELRETKDRCTVLDVAQRWGMSNRSTLTLNYRQCFDETPTTMLRSPVGHDPAEVLGRL